MEYGIRSITLPAENNKPLMTQGGRWEYFEKYWPFWLEKLRFRGFAIILGAVGLFFLFVQPLLTAVAWGAAIYFYQRMKLDDLILESQRRLVQAI